MITITTPRPPLNIFDVARVNVDATWRTLHETPQYLIPAVGPNPERTVDIVSLLTSLIVTNNDSKTVSVFLRVVDGDGQTWNLLNGLPVPQNDFALIELSKQNLPSGEKIEIRVGAQESAVAHLSFVSNQREEYTEIT